jgi:hypothetical protein
MNSGTIPHRSQAVSDQVSGEPAIRGRARVFARYTLEMPLTYSWRADSGTRHRSTGRTRDISTGGIYVASRQCPSVDAVIRFELRVPAAQTDPQLAMKATGRVVRVDIDATGNTRGFAVRSGRFLLSRKRDS